MTTTIYAPYPEAVMDETGSCGKGLTKWFAETVADFKGDLRIHFPDSRTYLLDGQNVVVKGLRDTHILYNGTRFLRTAPMSKRKFRSQGPALRFAACDGIEVDANPFVQGAKSSGGYEPLFESNHALHIAGCVDFYVNSLGVSEMHGDAVYVGQGRLNLLSPKRRSGNVQLRNIAAHGLGRHGICIAALDNGYIDGNTVTYTRRHPLHFERGQRGDGWTNVEVTADNLFKGNMGYPPIPRIFTSK